MNTEFSANIIRAADYLGRYRDRGRGFELKEYGLSAYLLKNCFCAGPSGQVISPVGEHLEHPVILAESFNYDHDDAGIACSVEAATQERLRPETVDEAAPMFSVWALDNIWHWMFNCMPKVLLLESVGFKGQYIVNKNCDFIVETLGLCGIEESRLLHCDKKYFIRNMFLVDRVSHDHLRATSALTRLVRGALLDGAGRMDGEKFCYIKRIGARKVQREYEEELLRALSRYGFETLVPEEHSIAGQIRFLSNSACTLGPHGANITLALFQKERSVLMEFFGKKYVYHSNSLIAKALKLLYIPIGTDNMFEPRYYAVQPDGKDEDFQVDVWLVEMLLENLKSGKYGI